jgi:hypothetical protein
VDVELEARVDANFVVVEDGKVELVSAKVEVGVLEAVIVGDEILEVEVLEVDVLELVMRNIAPLLNSSGEEPCQETSK